MPGTFPLPPTAKETFSWQSGHASVTHVPWCMSESLTPGDGKNVLGIPGACATRNFTYLARVPCKNNRIKHYLEVMNIKPEQVKKFDMQDWFNERSLYIVEGIFMSFTSYDKYYDLSTLVRKCQCGNERHNIFPCSNHKVGNVHVKNTLGLKKSSCPYSIPCNYIFGVTYF